MTFKEIEEFYSSHIIPTYDRCNYDAFLKHVGFSFDIKSIHITGTNGKGSTANYLYSIYKEAGYKVALYNSPYLSSIKESLFIDGSSFSEDEYAELFNQYQNEFEKFNLTNFEIQTFIALSIIKKHQVDLAIIEVGMGGYIDATNVIKPLLSIITNVTLEHTNYLGRSISEIAANKAGIIKENTPVLIGKIEESAQYAIEETAKRLDAPITIVDDYYEEKLVDDKWSFLYRPYKEVLINTKAKYEIQNASLAIEATKVLKDALNVSEDNVRKGLMVVNLSCRFEYVKPNIIFDGAHNPAAVEELCKSLENEMKPIHVLFACFKDKNIAPMLISLGLLTNDITITTFDHVRARTEEDYFLYLDDYKFENEPISALNNLITLYPDDLILVTGSLAFVGMLKEHINEIK